MLYTSKVRENLHKEIAVEMPHIWSKLKLIKTKKAPVLYIKYFYLLLL